MKGDRPKAARPPPSAARAVLQFALAGLAALALVGLGVAVLLRQAAARLAVDDAKALTRVAAAGIIEPNLDDALVQQDPQAIARLDRIVRRQLVTGSVARVKLWTADGRIAYSDEPRLIGQTYALGGEEAEALREGTIVAEVSDLDRPENVYERAAGHLLEVYMPVHTESGTPLLFETYQRLGAVAAGRNRLWVSTIPAILGALIVLELFQLPLAWSLARRLREGHRERETLLRSAIDASNAERRRIAAGLHDGIVQRLAGVSYALSAAADRLDESQPRELVDTVREAAKATRRSIRELRTTLVEIYPPTLRSAGIAAALSDLVAPLAERGIEARLDVSGERALTPDTEALLFRAAQEAIRNVIAHAGARSVEVALSAGDGRATLRVRDDGIGIAPDALAGGVANGHVGLRLLADAAAGVGGSLRVSQDDASGTVVEVEVPL